MKIVGSENQSKPFGQFPKGAVIQQGGEVYIKTEVVFDDDGDYLNALHAKTGEVVQFRDDELVIDLPNARLVLN